MRIKVGISVALVTVLVGLFAWAVYWALADRHEATYGLAGPVTTLEVDGDPTSPSRARMESVGDQLEHYLRLHAIPMILASGGDGRPELIVEQVGRRVPWFPSHPGNGAYALSKTWAADEWRAGSSDPTLAGSPVRGVIGSPPRIGGLQYAVAYQASTPLVTGQLVLGTTDMDRVGHVERLLTKLGLEPSAPEPAGVGSTLRHDAMVVLTGFLALLGLVSAALLWQVQLGEYADEARVRNLHGAVWTRLWGSRSMWVTPALALGAVAGAALTLVTVITAAHTALKPAELRVVVLGGAGGALASMVVWGSVLAQSLLRWRRDGRCI